MATFRTSDGLSLYYEDDGAGPPLLCLPGLTRNARDFDVLAPHMASVRMIRLDARGRGKSAHDPDYTTYTLLRESQDVVGLIDHLGLERVSLLGTSRGGLVAMALGARHPDRLASVVLNDVGPVIEPQGMTRIMDYVGIAPAARTYAAAAETLADLMAPQFPGVAPQVWRRLAEAQYDSDGDRLKLRYDPQLRTAILEQAATGTVPDLWPVFEALRPIPTGVLRGANSDLLSPDTVTEMQARHPRLMSTTVPDRGHAPFLDEPEAVDLITRVLEQAQ